MDSGYAFFERRTIHERRVFSWRTALYGYLLSRRTNTRRADNVEELFGDWHHPWLFFIALGIMLLSCADAFFTLQLISGGMIEANPIMAAAMNHSTEVFVTTKLLATGAAIMTLVFFSRVNFFNYLRTGLLLTFFFCLYCCLICYQIVNLLNMM